VVEFALLLRIEQQPTRHVPTVLLERTRIGFCTRSSARSSVENRTTTYSTRIYGPARTYGDWVLHKIKCSLSC
jgi:hypothetical protein